VASLCRDRCVFIEGVVCLAYCMYSLSCGIFVYKLVMSIDTRIAFSGILVLSVDCITGFEI